MSAHTPGPWEPMVGREGAIRGLRGWHGPESVNVVNWNGISRASSENGQANARLIAAAPELLSALIDLVEMAEPLIFNSGNRSALNFFDYARDAIAKATQP